MLFHIENHVFTVVEVLSNLGNVAVPGRALRDKLAASGLFGNRGTTHPYSLIYTIAWTTA
jgi:hypothetical protein